MGKDSSSFDIVSEADLQEVDNAVNQARKELAQRFDFKGSKSSIDYNRAEKKITILSDDEPKMNSVKDVFANKLAKRGVSMKLLTFGESQKMGGDCVQQIAELASGIPQDKAKELVKIIKALGLKVQAQIESEKVRVSAPKKDDLQAVISYLRKLDFSLPLSFCIYR